VAGLPRRQFQSAELESLSMMAEATQVTGLGREGKALIGPIPGF
jgi:hypothetical protein